MQLDHTEGDLFHPENGVIPLILPVRSDLTSMDARAMAINLSKRIRIEGLEE